MAGRPGTGVRAWLRGETAAVAGLFLAVETEGLSDSSGPWAGGLVTNVQCGLGAS